MTLFNEKPRSFIIGDYIVNICRNASIVLEVGNKSYLFPGAFIIPYFTVLILGAIPVFFMELAMGQFSREGPINVWNNLCPMFRGEG